MDLWQQDINRRALVQAHSQELFHVYILLSIQYDIVHVLLDQRWQTALMEQRTGVVFAKVFLDVFSKVDCVERNDQINILFDFTEEEALV